MWATLLNLQHPQSLFIETSSAPLQVTVTAKNATSPSTDTYFSRGLDVVGVEVPSLVENQRIGPFQVKDYSYWD